jgi:hypothetical protein
VSRLALSLVARVSLRLLLLLCHLEAACSLPTVALQHGRAMGHQVVRPSIQCTLAVHGAKIIRWSSLPHRDQNIFVFIQCSCEIIGAVVHLINEIIAETCV